MANSIDGLNGAQAAVTAKRMQETQKNKINGVADNSQQKSSGDTLSLTGTAENLRNLSQSMASGPEINQEKVESIKLALANGDYKLDAERVASKFIEIEKALGKL